MPTRSMDIFVSRIDPLWREYVEFSGLGLEVEERREYEHATSCELALRVVRWKSAVSLERKFYFRAHDLTLDKKLFLVKRI